MKNLWPETFDGASVKTVKALLAEQSAFLSKITGGVVEAEVFEVNGSESIKLGLYGRDFIYKFMIIGRFIDNYKFRVFYFWHDIGLYPVTFSLDEQLAAELGYSDTRKIVVEHESDVDDFLEKVFGSERLKRVVGSIMSLSR